MSPWRRTNERTTISENRASQQIDQGLLTFAIMALMTIMMMTVMASTDTWGLLRCSFPHQLARLARCFNVKVFMLFKSLSKDASNY